MFDAVHLLHRWARGSLGRLEYKRRKQRIFDSAVRLVSAKKETMNVPNLARM